MADYKTPAETRVILGLGALALKDQAATADLADKAATNAKLADMPVSTFKGRLSGAGAGSPQDMAPAQAKDLLAIGITDVAGLRPELDAEAALRIAEDTRVLQAAEAGDAALHRRADGLERISLAALDPSAVPTAIWEALARTADGYALIWRDGDDIHVGSAAFSIGMDSGGFGLVTADGHEVLGTRPDGSVVIGGQAHLPDPFAAWRLETADGRVLLDFDAATGALEAVHGGRRLTVPGPLRTIQGEPCTGAVSLPHGLGAWFQYHLDGADYVGTVSGRATGDTYAPHVADTPRLEVWEADGQSWQTINDYAPAEIDLEDPTGETGAAVRGLLTPLVSILRSETFLDVPATPGSFAAALPTISNGIDPGDLHRLIPGERYATAWMAMVAYERTLRRLGAPRTALVGLNVGWPGQESEVFLPQGATYAYAPDAGGTQTTTAALVAGQDEYLWARNVERRAAIRQLVADRWPGREVAWRFLSWIQGPFPDYDNALKFMGAYRAAQNALAIPGHAGPRDILWDQNGGKTDRTLQFTGIQAAVDFCRANASGRDWLVGPRYPHRLRDVIHHSSLGALEYAERTGQAAAYVARYGAWAPLWITGVAFSGATVTLTTNRPRQCVGDLVVDTTALSPAASHGFTLWDMAANAAIPITQVAVAGNTITLTAASSLAGKSVEVGYAARGPAVRAAGTPAAPNHAACWGNVRVNGRDAPTIIPALVQPRLDHWLCAHRKTYAA